MWLGKVTLTRVRSLYYVIITSSSQALCVCIRGNASHTHKKITVTCTNYNNGNAVIEIVWILSYRFFVKYDFFSSMPTFSLLTW